MQQTGTKGVPIKARLGGKGDLLGIVKWYLTILTNGICTNQGLSQKMRHNILWDFEMQMGYSLLAWKPDFVLIN